MIKKVGLVTVAIVAVVAFVLGISVSAFGQDVDLSPRGAERINSQFQISQEIQGNQGDLNGDGFVNGADVSIMLATWGQCAQNSSESLEDSLTEGEIGTFTLLGESYVIHINNFNGSISFNVNGEETQILGEGEGYELSNGATLQVLDIIPPQFAGGSYSVDFSLSIEDSCVADINVDGVVNGADLSTLLANWNPGNSGSVEATISEGEVETVTLNNEDYGLSISSVNQNVTVINVNGESTSPLSEGSSYSISSNVDLEVLDIIPPQFAGGSYRVALRLSTNN